MYVNLYLQFSINLYTFELHRLTTYYSDIYQITSHKLFSSYHILWETSIKYVSLQPQHRKSEFSKWLIIIYNNNSLALFTFLKCKPLHCGFVSDEGGNTIYVHWYTRKQNLHHVCQFPYLIKYIWSNFIYLIIIVKCKPYLCRFGMIA